MVVDICEYSVNTQEAYPVNNQHGIFLYIVHQEYGDVARILFRNIDFREAAPKADDEQFLSLHDAVKNIQLV